MLFERGAGFGSAKDRDPCVVVGRPDALGLRIRSLRLGTCGIYVRSLDDSRLRLGGSRRGSRDRLAMAGIGSSCGYWKPRRRRAELAAQAPHVVFEAANVLAGAAYEGAVQRLLAPACGPLSACGSAPAAEELLEKARALVLQDAPLNFEAMIERGMAD